MQRYQLRREPPNSGAYMEPSDDGYWVTYGTVKHIEAENAALRAKANGFDLLIGALAAHFPHADKPEPTVEALLDAVKELKELRAKVGDLEAQVLCLNDIGANLRQALDAERRSFDDYLRTLAVHQLGIDAERFDEPAASGNNRLRWAVLISKKINDDLADEREAVRVLGVEVQAWREANGTHDWTGDVDGPPYFITSVRIAMGMTDESGILAKMAKAGKERES